MSTAISASTTMLTKSSTSVKLVPPPPARRGLTLPWQSLRPDSP